MKAIIQRVLSASVVVEGKEISRIGKGLMCLIGIGTEDTPNDMDYIVKKILSLKLFPMNEEEALPRQWAKSVTEIQGEVLCVSQFTLHANVRRGSKPDFHGSMGTAPSKEFYTKFLQAMREQYSPERIQDGQFAAMMNVSLTNEGPVTIILDSTESRSGTSTSTSGVSTPLPPSSELDGLSEQERSEKEAKAKAKAEEKAAFLAQKQKKKEEMERRQRENAEKKKKAQEEFDAKKAAQKEVSEQKS